MKEELIKKIKEANAAYRNGNPIISDSEYDTLLEELFDIDPNNEIFSNIGLEVEDSSRKRKLPILMASMDKLKSLEAINKWATRKGVSKETIVILEPKFDGLSLCVDENVETAITRGDGFYGSCCDDHFKLIGNHYNGDKLFDITYGEIMITKEAYNEKYADIYENPRSTVASMINSGDASETLRDINYIKYGGISKHEFKYKHDILDVLNNGQEIKVPYILIPLKDLTEDILIDCFKKWNVNYELDGVIVEIDNIEIQKELGLEKNGNPAFARAFKSTAFEEQIETTIESIQYTISKQGLLKPVAHIVPTRVSGVTIKHATLHNARYAYENNIGNGSTIIITRSGNVIPYVTKVIHGTGFEMPIIEGVNIGWNPNGVELICLNETDAQKIKEIISFFAIIECDGIGEGTIKLLYSKGYKTIKDILSMSVADFERVDGFAETKAKNVYNSIQSKIKGIDIAKLMHSSNIFKNLGSKKLALLEHFTHKPSIDEVVKLDGFDVTLAQNFIDGYDKFQDFMKLHPMITVKSTEKKVATSNELDGISFCFTGVRRSDLEAIIESKNGKTLSGVSKNLTYLVCKDKNANSSKLIKAQELGVILLSIEDLENMLK